MLTYLKLIREPVCNHLPTELLWNVCRDSGKSLKLPIRGSTNGMRSHATDPHRMWSFLELIRAVTRPLTGNERERERGSMPALQTPEFGFRTEVVSQSQP